MMLGGPQAPKSRSVVAVGRGRGDRRCGRSVSDRWSSTDPKTSDWIFAAGHGGRLPRAVARLPWRGRHGAAVRGGATFRRALHGLRFGSEPHRVRQGFD